MKQLLDGMLNDTHKHSTWVPKQLCLERVTSKGGGLLNFTANQDASAMSLGLLFDTFSWLFIGFAWIGSHLFEKQQLNDAISN